jgi:PKD repeat protein
MRKLAVLAALASVAVVAAFATAPNASAYGRGSVYQIEISANDVGGVPGGGAWIWIGLNQDHTGDYTMADCIHTGSAGLNAAAHSKGDVTWSDAGGLLTIDGVRAIGGLVPVTIVVPDTYGHYVFNTDDIIKVPPNPIFTSFGGWAQTQIAP